MHTDSESSAGATAIIDSALARGVPVVSSRQMLTWLDGRNALVVRLDLVRAAGRCRSSSRRAPARRACAALLPASTPDGPIVSLTRGGSPIPFTVETVKGISYARFDATAGNYEATYLADTDGPVITDVQADPDSDGTAVVTWTTDEPSSSRVDYGTSAGSLTLSATSPGLTTSHSVTLTGLAAATTYHYRVTSTDASANSTTEPAGTPLTFTTPFATLVDTTAADFGAGTLDANTYLAQAGDGEVVLAPTVGSEFSGSSLPAGWTSTPWNAGGSSTVAGGIVTVDGALLATDAFFGPGPGARVLGRHRRRGVPAHRAGHRPQRRALGADLLVRRQRRALRPHAQRHGDEHADRVLDGADAPLPHRVDGRRGSSTTPTGRSWPRIRRRSACSMRPVLSDIFVNTSTVRVDWLRLSPYAPAGTFTSRVLGDGTQRTWQDLAADVSTPAGSSVALSVRTGDTATPDGTWTAWQPLPGTGGSIGATSGYIQYKADLATSDDSATPELRARRDRVPGRRAAAADRPLLG